ncbi:MAG: hypothetical protein PVH77_01295 [Phycisphaerales bacterium]|jgi:hypothetical protein
MNLLELIILLIITGIGGAVAVTVLTTRCIIPRRPQVRVNKAQEKHYGELIQAAESLEGIAGRMDDWIRQQREKFRRATTAFRKKWISHWFSDFMIMELFKDKLHRRQFDDIIEVYRLYMPDAVEPLREIKNSFLNCAVFMKQIEKHKGMMESNRDLGFWCGNFFDTTAEPTAERIRKTAELTRDYINIKKQEEAAERMSQEILDKQVGKVIKSSTGDITASEIARILNEDFIGVYKPTSPCQVGKSEPWKRYSEKMESRGRK